MSTFSKTFDEYMELKIFVDSCDIELKEKYIESAFHHNIKILSNSKHYDAGFDMHVPEDFFLSPLMNDNINKFTDFKIKCCAHIIKSNGVKKSTAFYTYARSSISKTSFRLANNQGIIDAGYRGNLMAKFDNIGTSIATCSKFTRLMQICAPSLIPIHVEIVDRLEDLGDETARGTGGFGSTGV
jgi:dUTPase